MSKLLYARDLELSVGEYLFELLSGDSDSYDILESYLEVVGCVRTMLRE